MQSPEKVELIAQEVLGAQSPGIQAVVTPMLGMLQLPEDPDQLDAMLEKHATMLLRMRSDTAQALVLTPAGMTVGEAEALIQEAEATTTAAELEPA